MGSGNDSSGRGELLRRLTDSIGSVDRFGLTHALLASLPVREAVTTNYDSLFEKACTLPGGQPPKVLPYETVETGGRWLLKLHGHIQSGRGATDDITFASDEMTDTHDDIVLTRSDYLALSRTHGALFGIVQAMLATRYLLFVGYSLTDEDFHELADEIRRALRHPESRRGIVLTLDQPLWLEVWDDLFDVQQLEGRTAAGAGRQLQIMLDLVANQSTNRFRHLLSDGYPLSEAEQTAKRALLKVLDAAGRVEDAGLRAALNQALHPFGGPSAHAEHVAGLRGVDV